MRGTDQDSSTTSLSTVSRHYRHFASLGNTRSVLWGASAGIGALLASVISSVAIAVLAWSLNHAPGETTTDAARLGLQGWFLSHGARIEVPWGVLSVAPFVLTFLALYFLYRAGRQVARAGDVETVLGAAEAIAAVVLSYTCVAVLLTGLGSTSSATIEPGWAALSTGVIALLGASIGVAVESGLATRAINLLPGPGYAYVRAGIAAAMTLMAVSTLAVCFSLVLHAGELSALVSAITPDALGGWVIMVLSVLYLPNAAIYGVAMSTGAGFSIGSGTTVSLTAVSHGPLPAFPLFAALPDGSGGDLLTWMGALAPLAAGIVAAVVLVRNLDADEHDPADLVVGVVGMAVTAGAMTALLTVLGTGSLGSGQLAFVGAVGWKVALSTGLCIAVIGALSTAVVLARGLIASGAASSIRSRPVRSRPVRARVVPTVQLAPDPEELVAEDFASDADEPADEAALDSADEAAPEAAEPVAADDVATDDGSLATAEVLDDDDEDDRLDRAV